MGLRLARVPLVGVFGLLVFVLSACGKADDDMPSEPAPGEVQARYEEAANRLEGEFLDSGFVVSRWEDGSPEHEGDALIFSGIALAALDCTRGRTIEDSLLRMVEEMRGGLYRHPTLKTKVSMDGALGLYFGVASRTRRCGPGLWAEATRTHRAFVQESGGLLNPESSARLEPEFPHVLDTLAHGLGVAEKPSATRSRVLEAEVATWARLVRAKQAACFRIHLGLLALDTLRGYGELSEWGHEQFCSATEGLDLPTVDHFCGRGDLKAWIDTFQYDAWEYRHQRCPAWESQDGKPGLRTPAIDLLLAIQKAYQL